MSTVSALPVPPELIHDIISHLTLSSDCSSCLQTDLASLAASSKVLNALATPYLYSAITLYSLHDSSATQEEEDVAYTRRSRSLLRTLEESRPAHGALVKRLQFAHAQPATKFLWTRIVTHTPNLVSLRGVENYFSTDTVVEDPENADEDDEEREAREVSALTSIPSLHHAVLHDETLSCTLETLLSSWPNLRTLALGEIIAEDSTFSDLSSISPSVSDLYFHDFDLDFNLATDRNNALATLRPTLTTLGIDYTLGFTLGGVVRYLRQSPAHAKSLRTLEFKNQIRDHNPLVDLCAVLETAEGLTSLDLGLTRYPTNETERSNLKLESKSLQSLRWKGTYTTPAAAAAGNDEMLHTLIASIPFLPALTKLTVAHEVRGREVGESPIVMYQALRDECERAESVFTLDAELVGKNGKRVLVVFEEEAEAEVKSVERILRMKLGEVGLGEVCGAGMEVAEEQKEEGEKECAGEEVWQV